MPPRVDSRIRMEDLSNLCVKEFLISVFYCVVVVAVLQCMSWWLSSPKYQIVIPNATREIMYEEFQSQTTKDCLSHWTRKYERANCYHGIYNIWENMFARLFAATPCDRHHQRKLAECPSKWKLVVTNIMSKNREDCDRLIRLWYTTRGYTSGRLGSVCEGDWGFTPCVRDIMEWEHRKQPGDETAGRGPEECLRKLQEIGRRSKACGDFVQTSMAQSIEG